MKKLLLFVCATLLSFTGLRAQENVGINFEHGTLSEAMAKAKAENKMVFLDCYTSWCGPCKFMASNVFTTKEAGDFFNKHFVNIKIDMEKGEGVEIAKKYKVQAFPTFILFDKNGEEQHRLVGGGQVADFIKRVEEGMNPETSIKGISEKYAKGDRNPVLLKSYVANLIDTYNTEEANKVIKELLATSSDAQKQSADCWWIYSNAETSGYGSENFAYLMANRKGFNKGNTEEKVNAYISEVMSNSIAQHLSGNTVRSGIAKGDVNIAKAEFEKLTKFIADNKINDATITTLVKMTQNRYSMEPVAYIISCKDLFTQLQGNLYFGAFNSFSRNLKFTPTKEVCEVMIELAKNGQTKVSAPDYVKYLQTLVDRYTEEMSKLQ